MIESVEEFGNRWRDRALEAELEIERLKAQINAQAAGTALWNVQNFDQMLGVYTDLEAAKAHGDHVIHAHYQDAMDRRRVPEAHRAIDWRVPCCGHLYGPGRFNHTTAPDVHADGCWQTEPKVLCLRPFWAASGATAGTGHVSTAWEIWQGTAYARFNPTRAF